VNESLALIREKNFGLLLGGQLISQIGENLNRVALLWFVYKLTNSPGAVATIGILQTLPPLLFGWLTGVALDRSSKKAVMLGLDTTRGLIVLLIPILYYFHWLSLPVLDVLVFLIAVTSGIFGPALYASIPEIVPPSKTIAGNAMMQTVGQFGMLLGPILGGVLVSFLNPTMVMAINGVTFLISAIFLIFIHIRWVPPTTPLSPGLFLRETAKGYKVVFGKEHNFLPLFLVMTFYGLITGPLNILLPIYAKDSLHEGSGAFGLLISALGVGMLLSSLLLSIFSPRSMGVCIRNAFMLAGLLLGGLSVTHSLPVAVVLLAAAGMGLSVTNPLIHTIVQKKTSPELLGRTFSTISIGFLGGLIIGMACLPFLLHSLGASRTVLVMGVVLFAGAIVVSAPLMRSERQLPADNADNRNLIGLQQLSPVEVRED
jgi:MFS family permease